MSDEEILFLAFLQGALDFSQGPFRDYVLKYKEALERLNLGDVGAGMVQAQRAGQHEVTLPLTDVIQLVQMVLDSSDLIQAAAAWQKDGEVAFHLLKVMKGRPPVD